jgi:hypothetical protein
MTVVVRFNTKMFDVSRERPNPINPIAGESLLRWLRDRLSTAHHLQIVRSRSLKERLLGRGNATTSDPCVTHIVKLLSAEKDFTSVQVESEA